MGSTSRVQEDTPTVTTSTGTTSPSRLAICPILTRDLSADLLAFTDWSPPPRHRMTAPCTASTRTPSPWLWRWPPSTTPSWRCPEPGGSPTTSRPNPWRTNEQREGWREERERERERLEEKRWGEEAGRQFLVNLTLSHPVPQPPRVE